jgi:hypothetical protein
MKLARLHKTALIDIENHSNDYHHVTSRSLTEEITRTLNRLEELETVDTTKKVLETLEILLDPKFQP